MGKRRTRAQIEQVYAQIRAVLEEDNPQSVRHIFYRMTDPRLPEPIEKTEQGYGQIKSYLAKMRRNGLIPYYWITDATRRGYHVQTYSDGSDFLSSIAGLYRADIWRNCDDYVEVWTESRSIAGVIQDDCEELAVSLYPSGGFSSLTLVYQAAEYINYATEHGEKAAHILYIGDYDPAGVLIDQNINTEIRGHLHPDIDLEFTRIAINEDQIIEHDLPTKPRKPGERRAQHIRATVEAEAMPASLLRGLLRDSIEQYMPPNALSVARVAEESEREGLRILANQWEEMRDIFY